MASASQPASSNNSRPAQPRTRPAQRGRRSVQPMMHGYHAVLSMGILLVGLVLFISNNKKLHACFSLKATLKEEISTSMLMPQNKDAENFKVGRYPWRFSFESPGELNTKRLDAIAGLKKHLHNRKSDDRNADDDDGCDLHFSQTTKPGAGCMYRHLKSFVDLDFLQLKGSMQVGREMKIMADPRLFGPFCTAFCAGINTDSSFEKMISDHCKYTHAFDCTVSPEKSHVKGQKFEFHQICIGDSDSVGNTDYLKQEGRGVSRNETVFTPLDTLMGRLNITEIDIFKFDIEGGEWDLIDQILSLPLELQPIQLMFEIHTEGAHGLVVPPEIVKGKRQRQVDEIFIRLYESGYGLMGLTINPEDHFCAEVSVIKITDTP